MKLLFFYLVILTFSLIYAQEDIRSLEQQLKSKPNDLELLLELGIAYHEKAEMGEKNAMSECEDILNHVLEIDQSNSIAMAYLGSALTIRGREATLPWKKIKYVKQGIEKIDKAVEKKPNNLTVRLVRAMNSLNLPSFFNRLKYSIEDFTFIIDSEDFKNWSNQDQSRIYYNFGLAYKKQEKTTEAQKKFELAIQIDQESTWGKKAKEELKTLK